MFYKAYKTSGGFKYDSRSHHHVQLLSTALNTDILSILFKYVYTSYVYSCANLLVA